MKQGLALRAIVSAICIAAGGCGAELQKQEIQKALSLTPEHFRQTTKIKDDEFESVVIFSTEGGYSEKRGLLGVVWSDEFLRAFVDKKSGAVKFQVYVAWVHQGSGWMHPFQANYGKPLVVTPTEKVVSDVSCTGSKYSGCIYSEHVAFSLSESEFRRVIEGATSSDLTSKVWRFRVKGQSGQDYDGAILLSEFFGLKAAIDQHRPVAMR